MSVLADWARSGAMALTGRPDGPPLVAPGNPATVIREELGSLGVSIPGLLGERAAYLGLRRNGPFSCGGAMRVVATRDGHVALSLSRPTDVTSVPALVESDRMPDTAGDAWAMIEQWAATTATADVAERVALLDLPGGAVPDADAADEGRPPVLETALGQRRRRERPVVIDLSSLWAGPLCAHLMKRRGAHVITVESSSRPDGARRGSPRFYELLHDGHEMRTYDFGNADDLGHLRDLLRDADLVIEASRPRALARLGIDAIELVRGGTCWLSLTARGRDSATVGFGDDVAACAGMVIRDGDDLLPVGDALADPLTGVIAATAAARALDGADAVLLDVSMLDSVRSTLRPVPDHRTEIRDGQWWVEGDDGRFLVSEPEFRR